MRIICSAKINDIHIDFANCRFLRQFYCHFGNAVPFNQIVNSDVVWSTHDVLANVLIFSKSYAIVISYSDAQVQLWTIVDKDGGDVHKHWQACCSLFVPNSNRDLRRDSRWFRDCVVIRRRTQYLVTSKVETKTRKP